MKIKEETKTKIIIGIVVVVLMSVLFIIPVHYAISSQEKWVLCINETNEHICSIEYCQAFVKGDAPVAREFRMLYQNCVIMNHAEPIYFGSSNI